MVVYVRTFIIAYYNMDKVTNLDISTEKIAELGHLRFIKLVDKLSESANLKIKNKIL